MRPAWWSAYIAAVALVPAAVDRSYTVLNLLVLLGAYATDARGGVWAALLVNFAAINSSFHLTVLEDPTVFERFARKFGVSRPAWYAMNTVGHVLPFAALLAERGRIRRTSARDRLLLASGTALVNLLWGVRVSRGKGRRLACNLSHIYVDLHDDAWKRMWAVALISHFAGSAVLP